ncbi:OFA family oxalate/formate antiporter-like MFS transporter [Trichococcus patagoniensis]|uniref:OFA family oxalate/formate antiporter-like MFS transporter n=1 Tax=Trichococcus patagoniensis TaxID=382641 RepID=A0A2T5IBB9_9LACT|nr:OFA family oxalate/formate antiporter-like MFS transporter [Trichococcus patagoniensis]
MNNIENKWMRAAVPALLIHCSIGTVYCWSLLKGGIAEYIGRPLPEVEWAFSLAIFCLGMSAAFAGKIVEKDIHKASLIAAVCFASGMAGTGFFIQQKSLIGIFLTYGVLMGIGCGIGYLSPVKTLMLWFKDNKGLATGIAVAGFGLAKVIASPIIQTLLGATNADGTMVDPTRLYKLFYILAVAYFIMMFIGHLLLKKPADWVEVTTKTEGGHTLDIFKNRTFIGIWVMFYLNITCGLALISQEKDLLHFIGFGAIATISSLTAIFNASGRLAFSAFGDRLKDRNTIYIWIFGLSIAGTAITLLANGVNNAIAPLIILLLCVINAGYGGGFSSLPPLLADRFGMNTISTVHGLALSAWAFAGLSGNQLSAFIIAKTGSYNNILYAILAMYAVAFFISAFLLRAKPDEKRRHPVHH